MSERHCRRLLGVSFGRWNVGITPVRSNISQAPGQMRRQTCRARWHYRRHFPARRRPISNGSHGAGSFIGLHLLACDPHYAPKPQAAEGTVRQPAPYRPSRTAPVLGYLPDGIAILQLTHHGALACGHAGTCSERLLFFAFAPMCRPAQAAPTYWAPAQPFRPRYKPFRSPRPAAGSV